MCIYIYTHGYMVNVSNPGETRNNFIFWMWFQSKQSIPDSIFFEWSCFTSLEVSFFLFTHVTCRRCQHYFLLFFKAFPNSVDLGIVQNHDNDELPKLIGCKANRQRPVTCLKAPFRVEKISPPKCNPEEWVSKTDFTTGYYSGYVSVGVPVPWSSFGGVLFPLNCWLDSKKNIMLSVETPPFEARGDMAGDFWCLMIWWSILWTIKWPIPKCIKLRNW